MRTMPYLIATESVAVEVQVTAGQHMQDFDGRLGAFDYLESIDGVCRFEIDSARFTDETGLAIDVLDSLQLVLQLDCPATGWRGLFRASLRDGTDARGLLEWEIPAETVAQFIEARVMIVLTREVSPGPKRSAFRVGSRVYQGATQRLYLEGSGTLFPVDAFEFGGAKRMAPWELQLRAEDLEAPFMRAVRLRVNSGHAAGRALLHGDKIVESVLFHDVFLQMLVAIAPLVEAEGEGAGVEGSLGAVLQALCLTHLGIGLSEAVGQLRSDACEFLAVLKAQLLFLEGAS